MFIEMSKEASQNFRLTSITIENFKGIGDAVTIPIRPITLLFGKNSAGKSTVLQALRYCEAILTYVDNPNPSRFQIELSGGYTIDLTDFPSIVHCHDLDRKIRIRIELSDISGIENMWLEIVTAWKEGQPAIESVSGFIENGEELFRISHTAKPSGDTVVGTNGEDLIRLKINKKEDLSSEQLEIYLNLKSLFPFVNDDIKDFLKIEDLPFGSNVLLQAFRDCLGFLSKKENDLLSERPARVFEVYLDSLDIVKNTKSFQDALKNQDLDEWSEKLNKIELRMVLNALQLEVFYSWLRNSQESKEPENPSQAQAQNIFSELIKIRHLGPFREAPQTPNKSWGKGFGAWDILARDPALVEKTNHYMKDVLKLGYSINQSRSNEEFHLHDEDNNIDIGLSDVGVGISQVIPVVVGALDDSHEIFAVEQPELHLHPAAQVALGDVFIDGIKNGNRTMLIETHSEHLLLRIMRRMRETFEDRIEENRFPVTPDDIAVLFVEWHDSQTIIREMPVNERGELVKAWPGGFFEEDIEEVFA